MVSKEWDMKLYIFDICSFLKMYKQVEKCWKRIYQKENYWIGIVKTLALSSEFLVTLHKHGILLSIIGLIL